MKMSGEHLHDGDQLRLDLFPEVPWDGRSPRGLTRSNNVLYLKPELPRPRGDGGSSEDQLELLPTDGPHRKRVTPTSSSVGATPLLVDVGRPRRGRGQRGGYRGEK